MAEEILPTLTQLMESVATIERSQNEQLFQLSALYYDSHRHEITHQILLPLAIETPAGIASLNRPPLTYLAPDVLYHELVHHHLFVALQKIATMSLMAENQRRIQHMEGAALYLEKDLREVSRRYQQLRQEEITEEIELITLNTFGDV